MRAFKAFISVLLLSALGVSLGGDVFANSHNRECSLTSTKSIMENSKAISAKNCDEGGQSENHCSDPCHLGQSHLGHGFFVFASVNLSLTSISASNYGVLAPSNFLDSAMLEGLQRPPRIA